MEARLRLSQLYQDIGRRAEALDIVAEVIRYNAAHETHTTRGAAERRARATIAAYGAAAGADGTRADRAAHQRLNRSILEDQTRQRMGNMWETVKQAEEGIGRGVQGDIEAFMQVAGTMVETFRLAGRNFGKNRVSLRDLLYVEITT